MASEYDIANSEHDKTTEAKKVRIVDDILSAYQPAGMDISSNPYYFGFLKTDGSWYIKKIDTTSGILFVKGDSGYTTAWNMREDLEYDLFNVIFG